MKYATPEVFALENFEGPLEFLLYLIQREEIDIYEVSIQKIVQQYLERQTLHAKADVDLGAEFIGITSLLLYLKSRMLLPKHEMPIDEMTDLDPRFDIIHQLLEYCRFKDVAKDLSLREEGQNAFFGRGVDLPIPVTKNLGVEHLTLQDLANLFKEIMDRNQTNSKVIHEEVWLVSDKIKFIQNTLKDLLEIKFYDLFDFERSKEELIVTFLAVLELMKLGKLLVIKHSTEVIIRNRLHGTRN